MTPSLRLSVVTAVLVLVAASVASAATRDLDPLRAAIDERAASLAVPTTKRERRDERALRKLLSRIDASGPDAVADLGVARSVVSVLGKRFPADAVFEPLIAMLVAGLELDMSGRQAAADALDLSDARKTERLRASAGRSLVRARAASPSRKNSLRHLADAARRLRGVARKLVDKRLDASAALQTPYARIVGPGIVESSGVAFMGGAFWTHGDSGSGPALYRSARIDFADAETLLVPGVVNVDWEDLAVLDGDLLVCDIGDNARARDDIAVHRVRYEPAGDEPARVAVIGTYPLAYPDGPHDAEAAVVLDGVLHIVVKRRGEATTAVFRFADLRTGAELAPDGRNVGEVASTLALNAIDQVTAADVDPVRGEVALLTYTRVLVYPLDDFAGAPPRAIPLRVQLPPHQYESLAFAGGWLVLGSEGGDVFAVSEFATRD